MHGSIRTLNGLAFRILVLGGLLAGWAGTAAAEEKKADPIGEWTWTMTTQNGETRETKLKIKSEADKLAGTISGRQGNETAIEAVKLAGDELSFKVTRERNGNQFVSMYKGKISGDTIKGSIETPGRDGQTRTREWEAKRVAVKAKAATLTGNWKYTFTTANGRTMEPTLKLKQDGDRLAGVVVINENEAPISEGKVKDGEATFQVARERNGETFVSHYAGKLEGEVFKGKIKSNFGGNERIYDFEAKRVGE